MADLIRGHPFSEYLTMEGVNHSTLRLFRRSPAHARQQMIDPMGSTRTQVIGQAIHTAVLEPKLFNGSYAAAPVSDRRTTEYKEFAAENRGKEILTSAEMAKCEGMMSAVHDHPLARELMSGAGMNEVSIRWTDEASGLLCKARLDRIKQDFAGWDVIADLKSTRDAGRFAFGKSITTYGYYIQNAFYYDGLYAVSPRERRYIIVAVESEPPHCVACYELDAESVEHGRQEYKHYLALYKAAQKSNVWPGYSSGIIDMRLPDWVLNEVYE